MPFTVINFYVFRTINNDIFLAITLILTIASIIFNVLFIYYFGKTPGKIALKIKVIKTDGDKVNMKNSINREAFSIISLLIWVVQEYKVFGDSSYLSTVSFIFTLMGSIETLAYFINYRCKTIHDYIGDTIVIAEK